MVDGNEGASKASKKPKAAQEEPKGTRSRKPKPPVDGIDEVDMFKEEAKEAASFRRKRKADEAFKLLSSANISELKTELGERVSYTVKCGVKDMEKPTSSIGVILSSSSFYVTKCMLDKKDWTEELKIYDVGGPVVFLSC